MARHKQTKYNQHKTVSAIQFLCLISALFVFASDPKSFGNPPGDSKAKNLTAVPGKTRVVIRNVRIEDPRIVVHIQGRKKSEESILDQLPSVVHGSISGGSAEIVLNDPRQSIIVKNANISAEDFSPGRGGKAAVSGDFHYKRGGDTAIDLGGRLQASLNAESFNPSFKGSGNLIATINSGTCGPLSFERLTANVPFSLKEDGFAFRSADFGSGSLSYAAGKRVDLKDIRLQGDAAYSERSQTVTIDLRKGSTPQTGDFSGSLSIVLKDPLAFRASLSTPGLDIARINEAVQPYLPAEFGNWSAQGKAAAKTDFEGTYSKKLFAIKGRHQVTVTGGGLGSRDGTKAAQGVQANADITFDYASAPERLSFSLKSSLSGGEFLWGTYYKDFSGQTVRADADGNFNLSGERHFNVAGSTDLFGAGSLKISGSGHRGEQTFSVDAGNISLQKITALFLDDYLKQNVASLTGLTVAGNTSFGVKIDRKGSQFDMNGLIAIDIASLAIPSRNVSISGLRLNLPFDLGYPKAASSFKARQGLLEIKSAEKDHIRTRDVRIPLVLSGNRLRLPEDADLHVARGDVMISGFAADDILSPDRKVSCGLKISNVSLRPIERSFTLSPITGAINAYYPRIEYYRDSLTAGGSANIAIFGGEIEMGIVSVERLSEASRKIDTDISFRNINLEQVTEKIAIGKMTGIIQGSLSGFEMEYGQPTRFVLDIDSVDTRGVSQRISVEAIQSISILGTGSGMSGVLNRGILSFFKDYPYSAIGIHATLLNDAFTVRGKIHSGGTEYLVKRGFLRGVDVVNQNPDNKISFRDMQERLQRIFESRKAGGPVVQ